jgi:hypothetical protein
MLNISVVPKFLKCFVDFAILSGYELEGFSLIVPDFEVNHVLSSTRKTFL